MATEIILINPRVPQVDKDSFGSLQDSITQMVPLGLLYIAAVLQEFGFSVRIVDFNVMHSIEEREMRIEEIIKDKPKLIGISVMTPCYYPALDLAKKFRNHLGNGCHIVMGGYHVTFLPEEPLRLGLADYIVRGEGEYAMLKIARMLLEKKSALRIEEIEGISYIKKGGVIHNSPAVLRLNNLDQLPLPDRSLLDMDKYSNPGTLVSTRGCVGKCQFCSAGAMGGIKYRTAKSVVEEVVLLYKKYKCSYIFFVDNTVTSNKKRTIEIFNNLKENNINVKTKIESRVSQVDPEFVAALAQNGVMLIQFGVESGNSRILKDIRKEITLEQVEKAVDICLENNISVTTTFIIGHPNDTRETVYDTFAFAKKIKKKGGRVELGIMTPFPGTEVFNRRQELGVEIIDWDYSNWTLNTPVIKTKNLSVKELAELYREGISMINAV